MLNVGREETKPIENWTKAGEGERADRDAFEVAEGLSVFACAQKISNKFFHLCVVVSDIKIMRECSSLP